MIDKTLGLIQNKDKSYQLEESLPFGILLATVGGFLDAYTFVGRGGVMSNAQTGNMVFLSICFAKGQWIQALDYVPPILAFVLGAILAELIKHDSPRFLIADWVRKILILEVIILFIVGFIPNTISDIVVNVIISFVASIQTSGFRKLVNTPYATVMCTGNLRVASVSALRAIRNKDRQSAINAIRFFTIILSFIIGAILGGWLTFIAGAKAIWACVVILYCATVLFNINENKKADSSIANSSSERI